jgi:hypothetical protein
MAGFSPVTGVGGDRIEKGVKAAGFVVGPDAGQRNGMRPEPAAIPPAALPRALDFVYCTAQIIPKRAGRPRQSCFRHPFVRLEWLSDSLGARPS